MACEIFSPFIEAIGEALNTEIELAGPFSAVIESRGIMQ